MALDGRPAPTTTAAGRSILWPAPPRLACPPVRVATRNGMAIRRPELWHGRGAANVPHPAGVGSTYWIFVTSWASSTCALGTSSDGFMAFGIIFRIMGASGRRRPRSGRVVTPWRVVPAAWSAPDPRRGPDDPGPGRLTCDRSLCRPASHAKIRPPRAAEIPACLSHPDRDRHGHDYPLSASVSAFGAGRFSGRSIFAHSRSLSGIFLSGSSGRWAYSPACAHRLSGW